MGCIGVGVKHRGNSVRGVAKGWTTVRQRSGRVCLCPFVACVCVCVRVCSIPWSQQGGQRCVGVGRGRGVRHDIDILCYIPGGVATRSLLVPTTTIRNYYHVALRRCCTATRKRPTLTGHAMDGQDGTVRRGYAHALYGPTIRQQPSRRHDRPHRPIRYACPRVTANVTSTATHPPRVS